MPLHELPSDWPRAHLGQMLARAAMRATFVSDDCAHMEVGRDRDEPTMRVSLWATPGCLRVQALLTPMPALPEPLARVLNDSAIDGPWASLAFSPELGLVANVDLYMYPTRVPFGSTLRVAVAHLLELRAASLAGRPPPGVSTPHDVDADEIREADVVASFRALLPKLAVEGAAHVARVDYAGEGRWTWRVSFEPSGPVLDAVLDAPPEWTRGPESMRHLAELNATLAAGALTWWDGGRVVWRRRVAAAHDTMDEHWGKLLLDQASHAHLALHRYRPRQRG